MATDYVLAAQAAVLAARLTRVAGQGRRSVGLCALSLAATALAALLGGTSHGLAPYLKGGMTAALWLATYWSIGLANLLLLAGFVTGAFGRTLRRWLLAAFAVRFLVYAAYLTAHGDFRYVVYDYAGSLAALLALSFHPRLAGPARGGAWMVAGVVASLLGAAVQQSTIALHPAFNHNDLFHAIQMVGLYFFYRAARQLQDAVPLGVSSIGVSG